MNKRLAIIGIDGADPKITEKLVKEGKLPTIAEMRDKGSYEHLSTLNSSQSPICWSSIITGLKPGNHGVHDFIIRDPKNMTIKMGMNDEKTDSHRHKHYFNLREANAVWNNLDGTTISLFVPMTFPAEKINGYMISGMGIPDARGTQGAPKIYSTNNKKKGKENVVVIEFKNNRSKIEIEGYNEKIKAQIEKNTEEIFIHLNEKKINLKEKQWSQWIYEKFNSVECVFRFKLLNLKEKEMELYLSPVAFSSRENFVPFIYPENLGKELVEECGEFKTLSFESDVYGLKEELIDEETWLEDMNYTLQARMKVANSMLKKKWNYFVVDFFGIDRTQHMFWHSIDKKHPYHDYGKGFENVIEESYIEMDSHLGNLMKNFTENDLIFIVSDHGFMSYRKNVELNKILEEKRLLNLKDGKKSRGLMDIDWNKTKAYAVGFGAIYLNVKGRERFGIISNEEYIQVRKEVIEELTDYSFNGEKIFKRLVAREEIYSGKYINEMPDVIPIYNDGFRAGRESVLGIVSKKEQVHDNLSKWSGDHIGPYDINDNYGYVFSPNNFDLKNASVFDLGTTAADYFGKPIGNLDGRSLLR